MKTDEVPGELSDADIEAIAAKDAFWFANNPTKFCYIPFARAVIKASQERRSAEPSENEFLGMIYALRLENKRLRDALASAPTFERRKK